METTAVTSEEEVGSGALVVYSRFNGDITKAVQKGISISDIQPENRVLVDGGMYVASASNLELDTLGFQGFLYLAFYQDMSNASEKVAQPLSVLVLNKLFKRGAVKPDVTYEGKNYQRVWRLWSGERVTHWLTISDRAEREAIGKMKVQLVEKHKLLFSNEFLSALFNPVLDALREAHIELGRF